MAFDYKKEYKALYQPPCTPHLITVPSMTFAAVRGQGDPNDPAGEYKTAIELVVRSPLHHQDEQEGQLPDGGLF